MTLFSMIVIKLWNNERNMHVVHKLLFLIHKNKKPVSGTIFSPQFISNDIMSFYKPHEVMKPAGIHAVNTPSFPA